MTMGAKIRAAREERDWSLEKLAAETDLSYSTVFRTESGRSPRWENVVRIARVLGLSLDDLSDTTLALLARAS